MADAVTLGELASGLRRRWQVASSVALAFAIGAAAYGASLPNEYTANVVVAFSGRSPAVGGDTVRVVLPKYVAYATAPATIQSVAAAPQGAQPTPEPRLPESPSDLASAVSASVQTDTGNLDIKVRLRSASAAAVSANAMAHAVADFSANDPLLLGTVVAPALPNPTPSGPPRKLLDLAGLGVGAIGGIALAFFLERGRPRVRTWRDIAAVTGFPVIGRMPSTRAARMPPNEAVVDPAVGAAARTLRTTVERFATSEAIRTLVVTSPISGEGKTTVASLLAVTLARLDYDVVLIDADLRRPRMAASFRLKMNGTGLSSVLRHEHGLSECVVPGPVPHLVLLPTASDIEAGDLLARSFPEVLTGALSADCDLVIVDAPPLLGGDDARTIAAMCDATLLVVSIDTLATSVSEAAAALNGLQVKVAGVVANKVHERGYGGYGMYGSY